MEDDKQDIKGVLQLGQQGEFWKILCRGIDENIEELEKYLKSKEFRALEAGEYKVQSEIARAKIEYLEELKRFPEDLGEDYQDTNVPMDNPDPYESEDDFLPKEE